MKVSDKFSFPLELRGSALSDDPAARQAVYDLEAILIHKGTSAIHGHYGETKMRSKIRVIACFVAKPAC